MAINRHSLKNKKILITAGPTWVTIDQVRVISNIATGRTGVLLAERLKEIGAKVTLILGPAGACCLNNKIKLIRYNFFDELKDKVEKELKHRQYDIVIHSSAVSDYRPKTSYRQKVKSGLKQWKLSLIPTPKIIDLIKKIDPSLFLVGFKFEPRAEKESLIKEAKTLLKTASCDLVVANTLRRLHYRAYIVGKRDILGPLTNRESLIKELIKRL